MRRYKKTRKRYRKVKGGACGSCMMPQAQAIQSGGACPCSASKLPITFGGVRRNRNKSKKNQKRVRFA